MDDSSWADGNYYEILGVPETATQEEIKRAYHTLARQYHPDKNPDDPDAAEKCKAINKAYSILGDETKRHLYDVYMKLAWLAALEFLLNQRRAENTPRAATEDESLTKCDKAFVICCGLLTGCYCCCCCCFFCCGKCVPDYVKDDTPNVVINSSGSETRSSRSQSPLLGRPITSQPSTSSSGLFKSRNSERTGLIRTPQPNYATLPDV